MLQPCGHTLYVSAVAMCDPVGNPALVCAALRTGLASSGAVVALVAVMKAHLQHPEVLEMAFAALSWMATRDGALKSNARPVRS